MIKHNDASERKWFAWISERAGLKTCSENWISLIMMWHGTKEQHSLRHDDIKMPNHISVGAAHTHTQTLLSVFIAWEISLTQLGVFLIIGWLGSRRATLMRFMCVWVRAHASTRMCHIVFMNIGGAFLFVKLSPRTAQIKYPIQCVSHGFGRSEWNLSGHGVVYFGRSSNNSVQV